MVTKSQILAGYLSTLFPKLGIFDVTYKTLRDLVYNLVFREELNIKFDLDKGQDTGEYTLKKIKDLQTTIDKIIKNYEVKIGQIFKDPELESYASFKYSYDETPFENIMYLLRDTVEEIRFQKMQLKDNPDGANAWLNKENIVHLRKILKLANKIKNDLQNVALNKIIKELKIDASSELSYMEVLIYIYVHAQLFGIRGFKKFEYCVVDESQDFSLLEYLLLNKVVIRGRFALFGDLNQSLESDGVKNWEEIEEVITDARSAKKFSLETNYRSTKQIINFANKILEPYTKLYLPKSIDRVGEEPENKFFEDEKEMLSLFYEDISKELQEIKKSIGVIVFESPRLNIDDVKNFMSGLEIERSSEGNKDGGLIQLNPNEKISYTPLGIYLMRSEDCKGLEFSKVYVLNLNLEKIKNHADARRAFVAVTRAMNELSVYGVK